MRISSKGRFGIAVVGIVIIAGLVFMWAFNQGKLPTVPKEVVEATNKPALAAPVASADQGDNGQQTAGTRTKAGQNAQSTEADDTATEVPAPKTWEDHLDEILLSDDNENVKADQILALMPTTAPEHQEELAQHLVNMVQDDHYDGTSNLLMNLYTPTNVADIVMTDLLNRNNRLKLNTLLAVVKTPDHPLRDNAREMLELFVQEDHGTNYNEWDSAVANWLKENEPDPQAQAQAADPNAPAAQ